MRHRSDMKARLLYLTSAVFGLGLFLMSCQKAKEGDGALVERQEPPPGLASGTGKSTSPPPPSAPADRDELRAMVAIPAGSFLMGRKNTPVDLGSYAIDRYEVLQEDYLRCVEAGSCTRTGVIWPGELMPASGINWYQADAYCRWAGKRLPTSQEWEKAARGEAGGHKYPWGDEWVADYANWCDVQGFDERAPVMENQHKCDGSVDGYPQAAPVNAFPKGAGPYGVMQMCGNQLEWTATKRSTWEEAGRAPELEYAVRGGAWWGPKGMGIPNHALITWMVLSDPAAGGAPHIGIRCARSLPADK